MRNIIITGAAGNLGEVVVDKFKSSEYFLNLVIRQAFENTERVRAWHADLTHANSVAKLVADITSTDAKIDSVIHLVGGYVPGKLEQTSLTELDQMINLNFKSAFFLFQEILPFFKIQGEGKFICIGAKAAGSPRLARNNMAYALSKQLLYQFVEIINAEGYAEKISAHLMLPTTLDTDLNRQQMPHADFSQWTPLSKIADTIKHIVDGQEQNHILPF
jgi:short-subunit dehydrogenase